MKQFGIRKQYPQSGATQNLLPFGKARKKEKQMTRKLIEGYKSVLHYAKF